MIITPERRSGWLVSGIKKYVVGWILIRNENVVKDKILVVIRLKYDYTCLEDCITVPERVSGPLSLPLH